MQLDPICKPGVFIIVVVSISLMMGPLPVSLHGHLLCLDSRMACMWHVGILANYFLIQTFIFPSVFPVSNLIVVLFVGSRVP